MDHSPPNLQYTAQLASRSVNPARTEICNALSGSFCMRLLVFGFPNELQRPGITSRRTTHVLSTGIRVEIPGDFVKNSIHYRMGATGRKFAAITTKLAWEIGIEQLSECVPGLQVTRPCRIVTFSKPWRDFFTSVMLDFRKTYSFCKKTFHSLMMFFLQTRLSSVGVVLG